jgi:hypothetical protein
MVTATNIIGTDITSHEQLFGLECDEVSKSIINNKGDLEIYFLWERDYTQKS